MAPDIVVKPLTPQYLILGTMPEDASPQTHIAAGEWCFLNREDIFPDWEKTFTIARSYVPADDAEAILETRKAAAWAIALLHRHAEEKTRLGAPAMSPYVWELLYGRWAITAGLAFAYAYNSLKCLIADYGHLPLRVPFASASPKRTWPDSLHMHYDTIQAEGMSWLLSRLLEHMAPPAWRLETVAQEPAHPPAYLSELRKRSPNPFVELYHHCISWLQAKCGKIPASGAMGMRGIAGIFFRRLFTHLFTPLASLLPVPQFPFTSQWQRVCVSLALLLARNKPSNARILRDIYPGTGEEFPHFLGDIFWSMLPLSLEDIEKRTKVKKGLFQAYIASSGFVSDAEAVIRYAGRVRAGARLAVVQHSPHYAFFHPDSPHPVEEGRHHRFCAWGLHAPIAVSPVKAPPFVYIKIANSHQQQGETLYYAMTLHQPIVTSFRLSAQFSVRKYRNDSLEFVKNLPQDIRKNLVLRPYHGVMASFDGVSWAAKQYPTIPVCRGDIIKAMQQSRITVTDYAPGSVFGQALMINSPLIWFFRRESHMVSLPGLELLERFRQAGILHDSPEQAAAFIAAIWDDVPAWWNSEPVQSARLAYLRADADVTVKRPLKMWIEAASSM